MRWLRSKILEDDEKKEKLIEILKDGVWRTVPGHAMGIQMIEDFRGGLF